MSFQLEVCIDNLESLHAAVQGGATRIELCSSLDLGGLTPSYGMMKRAMELTSVPIYPMIRPRQGDFLYDGNDVESMLEDIYMAKKLGMPGIVFGSLTAQAEVDVAISQAVMQAASGMGVTFHRAIDHCQDYQAALAAIMELGCERILTSGQSATAQQGQQTIAHMVQLAGSRLSVMAGSGVNADNVQEIIRSTGVSEVHLSGKVIRSSHMEVKSEGLNMGSGDVDDLSVPVSNLDKIKAVRAQLSDI